MNPSQTQNARSRTNRVLVALAAAWMALSLAIGGAVGAGEPNDEQATTSITSAIER